MAYDPENTARPSTESIEMRLAQVNISGKIRGMAKQQESVYSSSSAASSSPPSAAAAAAARLRLTRPGRAPA